MKTRCFVFFVAIAFLFLSSFADDRDLISLTERWLSDDVYYSGGDPFSTKEYADFLRQLNFCKDPKVEEAVVKMTYERIMSFDPMWVTNDYDRLDIPDGLQARGAKLEEILKLGSRRLTFSDDQVFEVASKIGTIRMIPKHNWTQEELKTVPATEIKRARLMRIRANQNFEKYRSRLIHVLAYETRKHICELTNEELIAYTNKIATAAGFLPREQFRCFDDNVVDRLRCLWLKKCESEPLPCYDFVHDRTLTWETPDFDGEEKDILRTRFMSENFKRPLSPSESDKLIDRYEKLKGYALKEAEILKVRQIPEENRFKLLKRWVNLIEEESRLRKIPPQKLNSDYEKLRLQVKQES